MISRIRRASALTAVLLGSALLTAGCQKVPLLAPSGSTITLTSSATVLPVNGSTDIIAQVIEASGTPPHSGTLITFTTNLGSLQPSEAETDIAGRVIVRYTAGSGSGTATITAISGGVSASGTNAIKIAIGAAAVGKVTVDASPNTIPATGGTSLITSTAFDVNGNVIGGVPISFTTDAGAISPAVATTDTNGKAQATLSTTKAATVTATAGLSSSSGTGTGATTTAAQTATVKVTVNVSPGITIGSPSPATPSAGQSVTFPLTYTTDAGGSAIQSVTVDFGDGSASAFYAGKPTSVSHTYFSGGSYSIRATAVDALGDTSTASNSLLVAARPQPTVSISATTTNPTAGSDVAFTASVAPAAGTGTNIARVSVNYNDGTAVSELGPVTGSNIALHHVFSKSDTYNVVLSATDTNGGVGTAVTSVFVQAAAPLAVTISRSGNTVGTTRTETFTATVTGLGNAVVQSYDWTIDGVAQPTQTTNQFTKDYTVGSGQHITTVRVTTSSSTNPTTSNTLTFVE